MLRLLFCCCLLAASVHCYEKEISITEQIEKCQKLANNGVCNKECLIFDGLESVDCRNVEYETFNATIVVNAVPFNQSLNLREWKQAHEKREKLFYRDNLTINITPEEYENITNHCQGLIDKWRAENGHQSDQNVKVNSPTPKSLSIEDYCPVHVQASFFLPKVESEFASALTSICQRKNNNGKCGLACRNANGNENFEKTDCKEADLVQTTAYLELDMPKEGMLEPYEFWLHNVEDIFRHKFRMQVTIERHWFSKEDFEEAVRNALSSRMRLSHFSLEAAIVVYNEPNAAVLGHFKALRQKDVDLDEDYVYLHREGKNFVDQHL